MSSVKAAMVVWCFTCSILCFLQHRKIIFPLLLANNHINVWFVSHSRPSSAISSLGFFTFVQTVSLKFPNHHKKDSAAVMVSTNLHATSIHRAASYLQSNKREFLPLSGWGLGFVSLSFSHCFFLRDLFPFYNSGWTSKGSLGFLLHHY